ncbi:MAG: PAS domain S-box protein [Bacteroidetes bacterium]|nr:PAS domain S-box protein [Bacteroidota bacterium]
MKFIYRNKNKYWNAILIIVVILIGVLYLRYTLIKFKKEKIENIFQVTKSISALLPKEYIKKLEAKPADIKKPEYQIIKKNLIEIIRINNKAKFAYIYTERNGKIYFIADSEPVNSPDYSPPGQEYTEADIMFKQPLKNGKALITNEFSDRWGTWISVIVPLTDDVTNKPFAGFAMDFNADYWNKLIFIEVIESISLIVLILFLLILTLRSIKKNKLLNDEIKEKKEAEAKIKEAKEHFEMVFNTSPDSIIISRLNDGKIININDAFTTITAYTREDVAGKSSIDINLWENPEDRLKFVKELSEKGYCNNYEANFVRKNGEKVFGLLSAKVIYLQNIPHIISMTRDINERKRTEKEIFKLKRAVESSGEAIFTTDLEGIITFINPEFTNIYGYTKDDVVGKVTPRILKSGVMNNEDYENFWKKIIDGQAIKGELINKTKDGSLIYIEGSANQILNEKNECIGFVAIQHDITNNKKAREALKNSEIKFRTLYDSTSDAVMLLDKKSFFDCNNAALKMFGLKSKDEFCSNHPADLSPPMQPSGKDSSTLSNQHIELALEKGSSFFEWNHKKINTGEIFPTEVLLNRIEIEGKTVLQAVVRDITERKQMEEDLNKSRNFLDKIINSTSDPIFVKDRKHLWVLLNDAFCSFKGASKEELIGKSDYEFFPKNEADEFWEKDEQVFNTGIENLNEESFTDANGVNHTILTKKALYIDPNGNKFIVGIIRDITERKISEDLIKIKNEQLQKINSEKDKLFSIISHDIRGPLSGFMGLSEMLSKDINNFNSEEIQDIATLMNDSSINLYRLIENLLEWSRMQMKVFTFSPKPFNIKALSDNAIQMLKYNAEKKNIVVNNEIPDNIEVFVDENMISSILRNLISNALKFTPIGGKININCVQLEDKTTKISVNDTGIGMDKNTLNKLFQIDQKITSSGTEGEQGTGLGLLLCKEFVEKHHGKIWAESEEGKGSTFSFTIK